MLSPRTGSVFGNYELVRPLGSGGMGVVYEGRHRTLGRRAAVKLLNTKPGVDGEDTTLGMSRFMREGRAASQVRHPHIVDVFDAGVQDGIPFLVMELVEGETLASLVARTGRLSVERTVELLLPVCSAVADLHIAGVIHRDLKPANVLLAHDRSGDPWPKVADFGVSRIEDGTPGLTDSGVVLGTIEYMSPEQARASREATELTDQYALGVMLYECVTGTVPFRGDALYDTLHAIVSGPLVAPSARDPQVPPAFDAVVLRVLERDPARRFGCVDDLGAALLAFASPAVAERWASEFTGPASRRPLGSDVPPSSTVPGLASEAKQTATRPSRIGLWTAGIVITSAILLAASGLRASNSARAMTTATLAPSVAAPAPRGSEPATAAADPSVTPPPSPPSSVQSPSLLAPAEPRGGGRRIPRRTVAPAVPVRPHHDEPPLDNGAPILDPQ